MKTTLLAAALLRALLASVSVGALALAGCSTDEVSTVNADLQTVVTEVAALTKVACGVVPTAVSIANIVAAANGGVATAAAIAGLVCGAVGVVTANTTAAAKALNARFLPFSRRRGALAVGSVPAPVTVLIGGTPVVITFQPVAA